MGAIQPVGFYFFILFGSVFFIFFYFSVGLLKPSHLWDFAWPYFKGCLSKTKLEKIISECTLSFFLCFYFLFFCGPCLLSSPPHTRVAYEGLPVWHPPRAVPQSIRLLIDFRISRWTPPFSTNVFICVFLWKPVSLTLVESCF